MKRPSALVPTGLLIGQGPTPAHVGNRRRAQKLWVPFEHIEQGPQGSMYKRALLPTHRRVLPCTIYEVHRKLRTDSFKILKALRAARTQRTCSEQWQWDWCSSDVEQL